MEGDSIFENLSDELKDMIQRLLEVDSQKRITIEEALNHPWFTTKFKKKVIDDLKPGNIDFTNFV